MIQRACGGLFFWDGAGKNRILADDTAFELFLRKQLTSHRTPNIMREEYMHNKARVQR